MNVLKTCALAGAVTLASSMAYADDLRFVMVSHIGSNDANMKWLTLSLEDFENRFPNVETEYVSTNEYSIQKHIQLIEQVIATKPDGIAVQVRHSCCGVQYSGWS